MKNLDNKQLTLTIASIENRSSSLIVPARVKAAGACCCCSTSTTCCASPF